MHNDSNCKFVYSMCVRRDVSCRWGHSGRMKRMIQGDDSTETPLELQVHGLCVPLSSFNEFNLVLKPPDPARPPRAQRPTTWEMHNLGSFSISASLQASSLTLLCPSFFIFPLLCLWSLHWFSFSEWRQWTNLSETSALLYTLSKTHFWIWAYIIAPKTWLYNIQQCRFAKNSQRDKTKESLNKSHFFSAKTPLTHTLSTVIIKPASFIYISR